MTREGTIIYSNDLLQLKKEIEAETGFTAYEVQPGDQQTWFGTSDKFDDFKTAIGNPRTGTIAYTMDNSKKYMYSAYKRTWYELD